MASKEIGFGIIGCGTIAKVHAAALADTEGAALVAVSSRRHEAAEAFAADVGCDAAADATALVADDRIEAVTITSSSGSHASLACQALRAGKHVVVEKPMAMTTAECRAIIETARAQERVVAVISQRRFESHHRAVKQAIDRGTLGRILLAEISCPFYRSQDYYDSAAWRGTKAEDGGALMNQAIHSVDLLLWLCGRVGSVFAHTATQTHEMEAEDMALALGKLEHGGFATIMASTNIKPGFTPTLNIFGENGSIKLDGPNIVHWSVPGMDPPQASGSSAVAVATHLLASHEHHQLQLADVVSAISTGRAPLVDGAQGFEAVALVEAIYRSAETGAPATPASL